MGAHGCWPFCAGVMVAPALLPMGWRCWEGAPMGAPLCGCGGGGGGREGRGPWPHAGVEVGCAHRCPLGHGGPWLLGWRWWLGAPIGALGIWGDGGALLVGYRWWEGGRVHGVEVVGAPRVHPWVPLQGGRASGQAHLSSLPMGSCSSSALSSLSSSKRWATFHSAHVQSSRLRSAIASARVWSPQERHLTSPQ